MSVVLGKIYWVHGRAYDVADLGRAASEDECDVAAVAVRELVDG